MNDYKGITLTVKARATDRAKITEAIYRDYPQATVEFVAADLDIPEAAVEIPEGVKSLIRGDFIASGVNSLLHSLFVDRVS